MYVSAIANFFCPSSHLFCSLCLSVCLSVYLPTFSTSWVGQSIYLVDWRGVFVRVLHVGHWLFVFIEENNS
ncbi:hypothetical protein BDV95DRAFT_559149 [Massariosphaeria phaeospora]|uniref:Uncharacterized protein n=1 Tax=Massariosphaeria phaeospora TaxID=100035 RepID=A0A7C8MIT1_9PLEO|nr:hypothetical protein BDV95DRAFT_559149 [Massariosphaeria phaeospora]